MGDGESHESDVAQAEERLPESVPETAFADGTVSTAASAIASVARPAQRQGLGVAAGRAAAPGSPDSRLGGAGAAAHGWGMPRTWRLLLGDKQRSTVAREALTPTKSNLG